MNQPPSGETGQLKDEQYALLRAEIDSLPETDAGVAWRLLYELYGELPIPERIGWKIAALLLRKLPASPEKGSESK